MTSPCRFTFCRPTQTASRAPWEQRSSRASVKPKHEGAAPAHLTAQLYSAMCLLVVEDERVQPGVLAEEGRNEETSEERSERVLEKKKHKNRRGKCQKRKRKHLVRSTTRRETERGGEKEGTETEGEKGDVSELTIRVFRDGSTEPRVRG